MALSHYLAFTSSSQVTASPGLLYGINVAETAGAAAEVRVHDSADNTGPTVVELIWPVAGKAETPVLFPHPVECTTAIYVEVVSGTVRGTVYWGESRA